MKLTETPITFTTEPKSDNYDDFAIECRRDRSFITKAVAAGDLNWGKANNMLMIVQDEAADAFVKRCRAIDASRKASAKIKNPH